MTATQQHERLTAVPYRQEAIDAYLAGQVEVTNPLEGSRLPWLVLVVAAALVAAVAACSMVRVTESTRGRANVSAGSTVGVVFVPIGAAPALRTGQAVTLDDASARVVALEGPIDSDTVAARIALDRPAADPIQNEPATVVLARPTVLKLLAPGRWLGKGTRDA